MRQLLTKKVIFVSLFSTLIFLAPLFLVRKFIPLSFQEAALAAVGIGAISKTLLRGFLGVGFRVVEKSGLKILERSAERTAVRTVERTAERALVRAGGRVLGRVITRVATRSIFKSIFSSIGHAAGEKKIGLFSDLRFVIPSVSLILGSSMYIVSKNITYSFLVVIPFLALFLLEFFLSRRFSVNFRISSPPDGIALQYLFSATGSFMPLTSEVEFEGETKKIAKVSAFTLLLLVGMGVIFREAGLLMKSHTIAMLGDSFLIYPLILSFPFPPLEGHYIFKYKKLLSLLVWTISLLAFAFFGSEAISNLI